ncbi:carbamoyl phosphate synthase small subunit [Furfurilactobacillus siliginis]|uniref:Carbamoyl phosphate synthase small chain n=1 Tax=Furfurilactobacillus siliginis TaxID=348151 RepID=A0A0R2LBD6_9LACO|nr:carbamoyl phosphate synthase small subunit [Furfurilactobacillus siliginis]KRN96966.1 carbamoyl phosphate synthase small subunit [Furfurilactobacillus siliginis]GEK27725.1 carbamoyl-phosphate synthase small chain [Furfurilactobacillus siliginis]
MTERYLILSDGTTYKGQAFGSPATTSGNIVFNTSVTGYQEIITDPIYHNQIIVFSTPTIGAVGVNHESYEAILPTAKGVVVREVAEVSTNRQRTLSLDQFLRFNNIPGISGIDTRQLVRKLRTHVGPLNASIVDVADEHAFDQLNATVLTNQQVAQVATPRPYANPGMGHNIVVIDFGLKSGILRELAVRGANVTVMPYLTSADAILNLDPDGIVLSSGPGDPRNLPVSVLTMIKTLETRIPMLGIGLGHELFALANDATIERLPVAHQGMNHPIREIITNRIMYAAQAEEFGVDRDSIDRNQLLITHIDLIDRSIQGLRHRDYPAFSVQFFPDAAPGPWEATQVFDDFIELTGTRGEQR